MEQLLATKLYVPTIRPRLVARPRLIDQLDEGLHRKLTLISAPAGFGKTTLVTEWVGNLRSDTGEGSQTVDRIAWLSLDEGDNEPVRFLTYFIAALNQNKGIETGLGRGALSMLQSPQRPSVNSILISLINDLTGNPEKIFFVLDDYHLIKAQPIHQALVFLLENLPPQLHLVIVTRQDPNMSFGRLRARDQLTELRAANLRFTSSETAEFLNRVMELNLSAENINALETRTEGWITGLQLAAISMRGQDDPTSRIKSFTGSNRFVLNYLVEEVLDQQPHNVQNFLMQTAILNRLTDTLCDSLTDQENSQAILEMLERTNLFIVPLDDERRWYRYHHLFADLLRRRLRQNQPEQVPTLHTRASRWYEQSGMIDDAIDHALRADDFERAIYLIEQHVDSIWVQGEYAKLQRWLLLLPEELVLSRSKLSIFQAWELFASGQPDAGERFLKVAELAQVPSTDQASETESQSQDQRSTPREPSVRGRAAAIQAWMTAYLRQNISGLIQHLEQALQDLPDQDLQWRSVVAITLADAHAFNGDMPAAYQARMEALKACEAAGNTYLFMYNSARLAINLRAQGRLLQVQELCQQRVQFAHEIGMSQTPVVGWLLGIWGDVLAEINDIEGAVDLVEKSLELTEHGGDVVMLGWSWLYLTRILFSKGDMAGAEEIVQKMYITARESNVPTWIMHLNASWQSRIWLAQDKLEAVSQWIDERKPDLNKKPSHIDGMEYIVFARVLIAQGNLHESLSILDHLLEAAQKGGDITREIELLLLQAFAFQSRDEMKQAMATFEQALNLGEPRGFYRIFVEEGPPMAHLLYEALARGIAPDYVNRLLQAFSTDKPEQVHPSTCQESEYGYIEPLSEREIEVLQLIAEGLTNPEIATRLVLSLYTIKTHTRNIYGKLDVNNRTQAVARARTLGILSTN